MSKHRTNYTKYNKPVEEKTITEINDVVEKDIINETKNIAEETSEEKTAFIKIPEGTKLNVRSSKSFEFDAITQIGNMQEVIILEDDDQEWYKICTASGIEGYIQKKYVSFNIADR